jgi:hypothetical protein
MNSTRADSRLEYTPESTTLESTKILWWTVSRLKTWINSSPPRNTVAPNDFLVLRGRGGSVA